MGARSLCRDFHGVAVQVYAERPDDLVAIRPWLCRLPECGPADGVSVVLRTREQLPVPNGVPPLFRHGSVQAFQEGDVLWLVADGCALRIDRRATQAEGWVRPCWPHGGVVSEVVYLALLELLRRRGLYHVHAACVVSEGGAVLLPADGRAGKTALTLAALRAGWRIVGDDAVWLRETSSGVEALGWPEPLHVDRSLARQLGLEGLLGAPASGGRWELDAEKVLPGAHAGSARPVAVVFPVIAGAETSGLMPLGRAEALARVLRQSPLLFADTEHVGGHLAVLRRLVNQCWCAELHSGAEVLAGRLPEALRTGLGLP